MKWSIARARGLVVLTGLLALALAACSDSGTSTVPGDADAGVVVDQAAPRPDLAQPDLLPPDLAPRDTGPRPPARWDPGPDMSVARSHHTALALDDHRLLVIGGLDQDKNALASAEILDLDTGAWSPAGEMGGPHWHHVALQLGDGRVLVAGGCSDGPSTGCMLGTGVHVFDPVALAGSRWQEAAPMGVERQGLCGASLLDGRALVVGGWGNLNDHMTIELFEPGAGMWITPAVTLSAGRGGCTATGLASGKVLVAGGVDSASFTDRLEVFDPDKGTLKVVSARLTQGRNDHAAALLDDGRVLIVGGDCRRKYSDNCTVDAVEIFDPITGQVLSAGSHNTGYGVAATRMADGRVLVTGGVYKRPVARIYDAQTNYWQQGPPMSLGRTFHTATLVGDRVVVAGGETDYESTPTVEIFTP